MKTLKKALAIVLAVVFVLSLAACHPKDEVAISAGDYKITSAMYSYFLTMADSEAKNIINTDDKYDTKAKGFSYYKQKIDDKPFETYVKDLAVENCLRYIVLEKLSKESELKISDKDKEGWESTADYYWNYAYGPVLIENGVGYATYKKIFMNDALYNEYFEFTYGKGGEKEISVDSIKKAMQENYSAVYMITHDYSKEEKPNVETISKSLDKYVASLKDGKAFVDVLAEYNKDNKKETSSSTTSSTTTSTTTPSATTSTTSTTASSTTSSSQKEEEKKPKDSNITILSKYEDTYAATLFEKYADVEKLKADEVALIHNEDAKAYYIVVKKDINADEYYLDDLTDEIRYLLKSDEFDKFIKDTASKLDYEVNKYAVNQFKVKKIFDGSELQ